MPGPEAGDPPGWSLLPVVLVRSTGFPVELLDAVRTPGTARAADQLAALWARLATGRREFLDTRFPAIVAAERAAGAARDRFKQWYAIRRCVERGTAVPLGALVLDGSAPAAEFVTGWNALVDRVTVAASELLAIAAREDEAADERLREIAAGDRFREAVLLSSPSMHRALQRYLARGRRAKNRRIADQLYGYLQRFAAKNETTSFFGPVDHAVVRPGQGEPVKFDPGEGRLSRRLSRVAFWAVQAIADAVAATEAIRPYLEPGLADGLRLDATGVLDTVTGRRVALSPADLDVLTRCDRRHRAGQLPAERLAALVRRRLVDLRLRPPSAVDDALSWLRHWLADLPRGPDRDRWLSIVDSLARLAGRFADAPVDQKLRLLDEAEVLFTGATGTAAGRDGGLYTDRTILYDEALGDLTVHIGPAMVDDLRDRLALALDLCTSYSLLVQHVARQRARDAVLALGGGRPVPYLAFVRALLGHCDLAGCLTDARVGEFHSALESIACAAAGGGEIRLDRNRLRPLLQPVATGTPVSPDVFLAATSAEALASGDYDVVIGEIHHGVQIWTHLLAFWPEPTSLHAQLAAGLDGTAAVVHQRRQGKAFPRELPGYAVEFGGRSARPPDDVLRAADLEVVPTDDGVALRCAGRDLRLHPGDPRALANWVFGVPPVLAPPIELGPHTPRIRIGGAVFQRETWHLPGTAFEAARTAGTAPLALARLRELSAEVGLPERWFARVDGERKPFLVDLGSLPSVRYLLSHVDGASAVRCTEVLPAPSKWWLPAAGGGRRGAEWRTTWVYRSGA
jgi:hypothetical protein